MLKKYRDQKWCSVFFTSVFFSTLSQVLSMILGNFILK